MRNKNGRGNSIIFGLAITIIAINMLLSTLGILEGNVYRLIVSTVAVGYGVYALFTKNWWAAIYGILFGLRFSAEYYVDVLDVTQVSYWSLFFIGTVLAFGLELLFGGRKRKKYKYTIHTDDEYIYEYDHTSYDYSESDRNNSDSEFVYFSTSLREDTRYIYSSNLKEVNLDVAMGSMSVFFQERNLNNDLNINVNCRMGNLELYIPREWQVVDSVHNMVGNIDVDYHHASESVSPYKVYIDGRVMAGNIEIHFI